MNRYGLLGYPLGHSFSKKYFLDKFKEEGIEARFENFEFEYASDMEGVILGMSELKGFAITIPHKQSVLDLLDETDDAIEAIGAVNCVKIDRSPGRISLKGYNTDVIGFEESFKEFLKPSHHKALVLGTGGASKAVEYVLSKLGISYEMVSRTKTKTSLCYEDITAAKMAEVQVIINTTPLGMYPKVETCPALPYASLTSEHYCYDLVYNPEETLFLTKAKANGAAIKSGMDMLELQAEANWRIWNED
ncbi:MAG: shikimate dehydrogenase [Bacteroidales bacterium]|jgi:shikimate dehydrogenase|nr:shikimate dehydrogenase [Bacteroidales bacterium]